MIVDKPPFVSHDGLSIFTIDVDGSGTRLATGGSDAKVKIWSLKTLLDEASESDESQHRLLATLDQHASPVNVVRFSSCGRYVASGADDNVVIVCELKPGKGQASFGSSERPNEENWKAFMHLRDHRQNIVDLAWSPDDSMIASCSLDNLVIVYDATRGTKIASLSKHSSFVKGVSWDPVGRYLASQSDDKSVIIWSVATWEPVHRITEPFVKCVGSTFHLRLDWSPHGMHLVAANAWKEPCHTAVVIDRCKSWDFDYNMVGHKSPVVTVKFNPKLFAPVGADHNSGFPVVALGSQDKTITVWLLSGPRPVVVLKHFFISTVVDLAWTPDGFTLFACSQDGTIAMFSFSEEELGTRLSDNAIDRIIKTTYGETLEEMGAVLPESAAVLMLQEKKNGPKSPVRRPKQPRLMETTAKKGAQPSNGLQTLNTSKKPQHTLSVQRETLQNDGRRRIIPESIGPTATQPLVVGSSAVAERLAASAPTRIAPTPIVPSNRSHLAMATPGNADVVNLPGSPAKKRCANGIVVSQQAAGDVGPSQMGAGLALSMPANQPALPKPSAQPLMSLSIPAETGSTALFPSEQEATHIDAKNAGNATEVTCTLGASVIWKDKLSSPVIAMVGNGRFVGLALLDGSLLLYTPAGRRMMPPISVLGGVSFMCIRDAKLLLVSSSGMVQVLDLQKRCCEIEADVTNLTPGASQRSVLSASLTSAGLPVLVLDNYHAYVFESKLRCWMRVADNDFSSSAFSTTMVAPSGNIDNELALLQMSATSHAGGSDLLSRLGSPAFGKQNARHQSLSTRRHLETLLEASRVLQSAAEYKKWLGVYAEHLAREREETALRELCLGLLGPPRLLSDVENSADSPRKVQIQNHVELWGPTVLGMDKRSLLKDVVLRSMADSEGTQHLLAEMLELIQEVESH